MLCVRRGCRASLVWYLRFQAVSEGASRRLGESGMRGGLYHRNILRAMYRLQLGDAVNGVYT